MTKLFFIFCLFPFVTLAQNALPPIGAWREHLPYGSAKDVAVTENKIFAATPFSLFSVTPATGEVQRFSKTSGLSETGISAISYNADAKKLIIAYSNSNLDILAEKGITNIPGIKRSGVAGDKTVYHIYPSGNLAYLSTGLGVLLLDLQKNEIRDSWFIGNGGNTVKVNMFTRNNLFYYAATEEGLKRAPAATPSPADFRSWQNLSGSAGLSTAACKGVVALQQKIIALQNDSLFIQNGSSWNLFYTDNWPVVSINVTGNVLAVCHRAPTGESKVVYLNDAGAADKILVQPGVISFPQKGAIHSSGYWVADLYGGLSHWQGNSYQQYKLSSPEDIATGGMAAANNVVYATAGSVNSAWNYQYNGSGLYELKEGTWTNYNRFHFPQLDSLLDFITVAVDPRDASVWAGSYGGGLLHIRGTNDFQIFKQASPIGATIGDARSYRVSGLAFDAQQNLWISNFGAARYLHVLKRDGAWQSFISPFSLTENAVAQIVVDDADGKWIVAPKNNGLLLFNHGASIEDTGDDKWKQYKAGTGNGNLPSSDVLCVAKDKIGDIWVGTADGVAVIPCIGQVFTQGCEAVLPVAKDGAFAGYLFKGEEVKSIAVDGANRKWIGTKNGAWLINADGDGVLAHYTEANSPLLSNDVRQVAINGTTGEVFFGTAKGICSFRGAATEAATDSKTLLVFPNPVPPDYGGTIAIRGLAANSFVKITELNGRLVYQTKVLGGQALWNGRDYTGRKVATGVYLVLVTDELKQETAAGKIVFIHR